MSPLAVLYLVAAVGLAVSAVALWTVRGSGSARALAVMLGLNAAIVTRNAAWALGLDVWWMAWPPVGMLSMAAFAASPPLLAFAVLRGRAAGPLPVWDRRLIWLFAFVGAGLHLANGQRGDGSPLLSLVVLNAFAVSALWVAGRAVAEWSGAGRRAVAAVVAVYAAHWACSMAGWIGAIRGAAWGPVAEGLSVALLLLFGAAVAGLSLRWFATHLAAETSAEPDHPPAPPSPASQARPDPADALLANAVSAQLDDARAYLDPDLTLDALAATVRAPARDVSRVLGTHLDGGFHAAVARRRVAEAQRLLLAEPDTTILDVLYRSGFNSKSAFHRAFRAEVGQTPSAYRRNATAAEVPVPAEGRQPAA